MLVGVGKVRYPGRVPPRFNHIGSVGPLTVSIIGPSFSVQLLQGQFLQDYLGIWPVLELLIFISFPRKNRTKQMIPKVPSGRKEKKIILSQGFYAVIG